MVLGVIRIEIDVEIVGEIPADAVEIDELRAAAVREKIVMPERPR